MTNVARGASRVAYDVMKKPTGCAMGISTACQIGCTMTTVWNAFPWLSPYRVFHRQFVRYLVHGYAMARPIENLKGYTTGPKLSWGII